MTRAPAPLSAPLAEVGPVTRAVLFDGIEGNGTPPHDSARWRSELDALLSQGLASIALAVLARTPLEIPDVRAVLREASLRSAAVRLQLEARIAPVVGALERAGVRTLMIKGPALAASVPALAGRAFGDVDLLVSAGDLDRAETTLEAEGYVTLAPQSWEPRRGISARFAHARTMVGGGVAIDVHRVVPPPVFGERIPFEGVWSRAQSIDVHGRSLRVPSRTDLTVMTALHAVSALANRQLWPWRDIAHLLAATDAREVGAAFARYDLTAISGFVTGQLNACGLRVTSVPSRHGRALDSSRIRILARGGSHHRVTAAAMLPVRSALVFTSAYAFPDRAQLRARFPDRPASLPRWWSFCVRQLVSPPGSIGADRPEDRPEDRLEK